LALEATPDADDAPAQVVVDRRRLARLPDERDDRVATRRVHVDEMLAVAVVRRLAVARLEQPGIREGAAQEHPGAPRDRVGALLVGDERVERAREPAQSAGPTDGARGADELEGAICHPSRVATAAPPPPRPEG